MLEIESSDIVFCFLCSKKLTKDVLTSHLQSISHIKFFGVLHYNSKISIYKQASKNNLEILKTLIVDMNHHELEYGRGAIAICSETQHKFIANTINQLSIDTVNLLEYILRSFALMHEEGGENYNDSSNEIQIKRTHLLEELNKCPNLYHNKSSVVFHQVHIPIDDKKKT